MEKLLILATVFLIGFKEVNANIIVPETKANYAECFGSLLVVTETGELRYRESQTPTRFIANSFEVEGCGCFELYMRRNFKSTSYYISHYMGNISGDNIGFTIRSVKKVPCNEYTKSNWEYRRTLGYAPRRHRHHRRDRMHQVPTEEREMQ